MNRVHVVTTPDTGQQAPRPLHFTDRLQAKRAAAVLARKAGWRLHARPRWVASSPRAATLLDHRDVRTGFWVETFPLY